MALDADPYRILGLPTGAPLAEVKRAYRRLAKTYHPDTAGEAAIPRFLAIQAAYEALVGSDGRGRRRPGVARQPPWQADPERSRATRETWQRRAGRRPGASDEGDGSDAGQDDQAPDAAGPTAAPGRGSRRRRAGRSTNADSDRRPPDRATPGSTTYDSAEHEPMDPNWSGASWYGQSSGTYWTINPKEYADPRKHGPEYQARGRRREADGEVEPAPPEPPVTAGGGVDPGGAWAPRPAPAGPSVPPVASVLDPALPGMRGPGVRVGIALIGWPPIGLALALMLGELSGCARFSASCVEMFSIGSWVVQVIVIGLLLLVPALAAIAAVGSIAVLASSIPAAVVLSAAGGSREPAAAGAVLLLILAVAWIVGVGLAVARRSRTVPP